jgi:hypothetical protein
MSIYDYTIHILAPYVFAVGGIAYAAALSTRNNSARIAARMRVVRRINAINQQYT